MLSRIFLQTSLSLSESSKHFLVIDIILSVISFDVLYESMIGEFKHFRALFNISLSDNPEANCFCCCNCVKNKKKYF